MTKVLIDGDIVAYRAAFSSAANGCTEEEAEEKVDEVMEFILNRCLFDVTDDMYEVYLTGKGNFRYDIYDDYKGNRTGDRPQFLDHAREYMIEHWNAVVVDGEEADDRIAIRATQIGPEAIIASVDKDFLQVPCRHYNFGRDKWYEVDEFEGIKFFYTQVLTGDRSDNIPGIYGVGPKKAEAILDGCETEEELYDACLIAYAYEEDELLMNAQLLWLRREEGQIWQAPE
jgi:DNA polymerase-1